MADLASTCKDKLAYFRIKELKDVLNQLGLPKQGKKQDLIDRVLALLSDEQGQRNHGWGKKMLFTKEAVAKIVDDTYRKMQVHGAPDLASRSHSGSDFSHLKPKEEADVSCQLDTKVRCLCSNTLLDGPMIKCENHRCQVWQHMSCVLIPERPMEGVSPEVPSHFYCELCRLSRADPFWVPTGNPLLPVKFMSSVVANEGTNIPQSVEKTFQLSRADRETVQRSEYDLQVWCMLLNDKVQFRMHWPQYAELQVNGIPVRVVTRPGSQLLGINGRDDGPLVTTCSREGINKICLSRVDNRTFCFGIRIARRRTVDQVLNLVPKEAEGESFEDALARVRRCLGGGSTTEDADSDSDLEVVTESVTVNLRCPNSGSRIRIAGRFKPCVHLGCFDLQTFVELNQRSRKWQCPICLKNYSLENLIIDSYFNRITSLLRNCNEDVNEIDVKPDGSWRAKGDIESRELSQWHRPDGTLCDPKEDTIPGMDNANQFKQGNSDGHRSLKIQGEVVVEETYALGGACKVLAGMAAPLGATAVPGGVNFAVYSGGASAAALCLFTLDDLKANRVTEEVPLDPRVNQTGNVWHVFIQGELRNMLYGYKFDGLFAPERGQYYDASPIVLDPYARAVISRGKYGVPDPGGVCWPQMAGMIPLPYSTFDWQGDLPLRYPQKDLVIYEMHLRGFTKHDSSNTEHPGTYIGAVAKLDYLKELGVNCVELMPCQEFNELEYFTSSTKMNFWGYSTINFFSPMIRYSSAGISNCGRDAINEFKTFVREAHKRGIEVILDVVFNHTAEGNENGPILSFRGIDNSTYYMLAPKGEFYNYSGCGNTFNCNHPVVRQFIVDCLRYWVTEMHVDGFRFDLASIMTRGCSLWDPVNVYGNPIEGDIITTGTPLVTPPLIDMISNDPILGGTKLIAEAWDAGGLYQVGQFPHWNIWSEWNGKYRDIVRQFIKGTDGFAGGFAKCLCGSPHLYQGGGRKPWHSINFVCAHDGFTLADLVTYNNKYNLSNGEDNRDGENHNLSWNCGEEGEFASLSVRRLRKRQVRNFFVCLMVSQGVPMFYMGDEYGHTKGGNNNTYCHDHYVNYFRWDKKEEQSSDLYRFCCLMIKFRTECESLGLEEFPTAERLRWHGHQPGKPKWSETSRFVAFSMADESKGEIYVAFNASHLPVVVGLPERPGYRWEPVVDTGKPAPYDFVTDDLPDCTIATNQYSHFLDSNLYPMLSYSSIILVLRPDA